MPTPMRPARGLRLRGKAALSKMAAAIGEAAYRRDLGATDGQPSYAILTGTNRTGTGTRLMRGEAPSIESFAVVSQRYAEAAGIGFWDAAQEMFEPIDEHGNPVCDAVAQAAAA